MERRKACHWTTTDLTPTLLDGEHCPTCEKPLNETYMAEIEGGIEKDGALLFPILCRCGAITVIGEKRNEDDTGA